MEIYWCADTQESEDVGVKTGDNEGDCADVKTEELVLWTSRSRLWTAKSRSCGQIRVDSLDTNESVIWVELTVSWVDYFKTGKIYITLYTQYKWGTTTQHSSLSESPWLGLIEVQVPFCTSGARTCIQMYSTVLSCGIFSVPDGLCVGTFIL